MPLQIEWNKKLLLPKSQNAKKLYTSYKRGKRQICLSGCRSSGKTSNIWPYVISWCAMKPGFTVIIARKEYSTLVESTMETLNEHVLAYPFYDEENNPWVCDGGMNRPRKLIFHNGSTIRLMGLRDPEQVKGQEPNIFWHNEASREKTPKPWILVSGSQTAGRGGSWMRHGRPFSQIIADTNPDAPSHWLWKFFHPEEDDLNKNIIKRREWIGFKLEDNPAYTDDGITLNSLGEEAYEDLLADHPPGIDRDRYVFGIWCAAEGSVLQNFDFRKHVISRLPDMSGKQWKHYRGIDFGDDDPFVCIWSSLNTDNGNLITHREWRMTHTGLDDHAEAIIGNSHEEYEWTVADSADAMGRRHLRKHGIKTAPSYKDIREGVRAMKKRVDRNQWYVFRNLLIEKDHRLVRKNEPLSIIDELGSWCYPERKTGGPKDDLPDQKCETHGIDPARYKIVKLEKELESGDEKKAEWTIADLRF